MGSIAPAVVHIQTSPQSIPSTPSWLGEITLIVHHLQRQGVLAALEEQVRFARRRFGRYEVVDFLAVLFGYAVSSERTLEAFYERLEPWASAFMALFGRDRLPARSTLSRFLAALDQAAVEALRSVFLHDLLARPLVKEELPGGLWDRLGNHFFVFDIDGTREAARQRALPVTADRPTPVRRLRPLCAPGYTGRKRGEVVRSRTTILQAHTYQWLATFGNAGNGEYRVELRRAVAIIQCYLKAHQHPKERTLVRLDGQYGNGVVLSDLAGLPSVMRGKDYHLLKYPEVQTRLHLPPDQHLTHPESGIVRALYDCPGLTLGPKQEPCRVVIATHRAPVGKKSRVGVTRDGVVYELFYTTLPQNAFTASDVVALYLHRGAFEIALADEDLEQEPDRWCSHTPNGQEAWQIISQWVWNLRLELGHQLAPDPVRTTEFAPALATAQKETPSASPAQGYGPAAVAMPWKTGRFSGQDFALQPDGTLRCPAGQTLSVHERRPEADGSLRLVYAASIRSCRPCSLREQCQWLGSATTKPRQVSVLLHPLVVGCAPLLWRDWSRRRHRRACKQLLRSQRVEVLADQSLSAISDLVPAPLSRAQRAHYRLDALERLLRNARAPTASRVTIRLFGVPEGFAAWLGLAAA
jgi:hypothetical protein